jgi:hypothetical protein
LITESANPQHSENIMQKKPTPLSVLLKVSIAVAVIAFLGPGPALADFLVNSGQPVVISDDVWKRTVSVASASPAAGDGGDAAVGDDGSSNTNNGHGNNEDGVDSSNPGQGGGGPNGGTDASCDGSGDCVDDEKK